LGLASRISGITPATVSLLLVYLKKNGYKGFSDKKRTDSIEAGAAATELIAE
jgi:tRNA uridine 5-carboxymethylaminomethyl modification enzyme